MCRPESKQGPRKQRALPALMIGLSGTINDSEFRKLQTVVEKRDPETHTHTRAHVQRPRCNLSLRLVGGVGFHTRGLEQSSPPSAGIGGRSDDDDDDNALPLSSLQRSSPRWRI